MSNLITPAANGLFLYGLVSLAVRRELVSHRANFVPWWMVQAFLLNLEIAIVQMAVRVRCTARIYGWSFASAAPLRTVWGNMMNCTATIKSLIQFFQARRNKGRVAWLKTDHLYPAHAPLASARPRLGEVLVRMRCVPMSVVEEALVSGRNGLRLGEYLVQVRKLSEESLYQALSCRIWELREELDLLEQYIEVKRALGRLAIPSLTSYLPGTYRGGMVARLQRLLVQRPDGTFIPARERSG